MPIDPKVVKALEKSFGDFLVDPQTIIDRGTKVLSVSPSFDLATYGGIPKGSWVNISGAPKCGKSTLALWIIRQAQQQFNADAVYTDIETRVKTMNLLGIPDMNISPDVFHLLQATKEHNYSAEELLTINREICRAVEGCISILDSASALTSANELSENIRGDGRSGTPKIMASFCRHMKGIVPTQEIIMVVIHHLIANTSGYGKAKMEDGGNKIQYQSDIKLVCKGVERWEKDGKQIGQIVTWKVEWCALGPPGGEIRNYIRYNYGIDELMELIEIGTDLGLISKGGSWYSCDFLEDQEENKKVQGQENLYQFLLPRIDAQKLLKQKISEMYA